MKGPYTKYLAVVAFAIAASVLIWELAARPSALTPSAELGPTTETIGFPVALFQGASSSTQPKITWAATSTEVILSAGESRSEVLSFTSDRDLQNVVVEAVPEIAGFLTIQPNDFASIQANQQQTVHIMFSIPATGNLGTFDGTIHVRVGDRTIPQSLKVVLRNWQRISQPESGYSFLYSPSLEAWPSASSDSVTVSNITQGSQSNPESMVGVCKVTFNRFQKTPDMTLLEWLESDTEGVPGNPPTPISINSFNGLREKGGESILTDTVYLELSTTTILSVRLICGHDVQLSGVQDFERILSTISAQ